MMSQSQTSAYIFMNDTYSYILFTISDPFVYMINIYEHTYSRVTSPFTDG